MTQLLEHSTSHTAFCSKITGIKGERLFCFKLLKLLDIFNSEHIKVIVQITIK
jgi:hypothetical protein